MAGNPRTDARRQAAKRSLATPLVCSTCGERLRLLEGLLTCPQGHSVAEAGKGVFDLWPPDREPPSDAVYSTPFGWLYDSVVNARGLARLSARMEWGTDIPRMYRLMD